jgi:hypothetical protein
MMANRSAPGACSSCRPRWEKGTNAGGRALQEAAAELWPGVSVAWLDTLATGVGPLFRAIYEHNVESPPWLYQLFYDSLCHRTWFAHASKRFVGAWAGRRLAARLQAIRPDLIPSTHPLGSAALEWRRRHRSPRVPVAVSRPLLGATKLLNIK